MTKKCLCNAPKCAKCLVTGCKDVNCPTHSRIDKIRAKQRILANLISIQKKAEASDNEGLVKIKRQIENINKEIKNISKRIEKLFVSNH